MGLNETQEKKDIAQKDFMAFPDITADTINALLYQGKKLVNAKNLWAGPTETIYEGRENEMRHLPRQTRELFQSDMRIVVDFLAEGNSYRSDRKIRHNAALIRMIKVLSGENDTENIEEWLEQKGIREEDEVTVCELFDQYVRQGKAEGKARQLVEDIERTMEFFHVTLEKACECLGITVSGYEEAKVTIHGYDAARCFL